MKASVRSFVAVAAVFGLAACIPMPENPVIGPDRHFAFTTPGQTTAPLTIRRMLGSVANACSATVKLNDTVAARMNVGEEVTLHVPEGAAVIRAELNQWCDPFGDLAVTRHAQVVRGQPAAYAFGYDVRMVPMLLR